MGEQILTFFPNAFNQSLFQYSFTELQRFEKDCHFNFLEIFKIYQIILETNNRFKKQHRIKIFLHWLAIKEKEHLKINSLEYIENIDQIKTWHNVLKSVIKYKILTRTNTSNNIEEKWLKQILSSYCKLNLQSPSLEVNNSILIYYKKITQFKFRNNLFLLLFANQNTLDSINYFKFIKHLSISKLQKLQRLTTNTLEKNLKPNIYFYL